MEQGRETEVESEVTFSQTTWALMAEPPYLIQPPWL